MFIAGGYRSIGRWSALLAAYAFVFNALLATTLLAATPPAKSLSGFELCSASNAAVAQPDHDDKATRRAAFHCQLCLQQVAPAVLPPPSPAVLPLRVVQRVAAVPHTDETGRQPSLSSHSARGPPHLG